jgi:preprotein translocase subunit YajC
MSTMFELPTTPALVIALQQTAAPQSIVGTLLPFALMLLIFYVLVLMPMRKRQRKVAEFQTALKVGDKVITTGGIYGQITRIDAQVVQLQIAEKVKIDVARAAVGGFQGQEPVVPRESGA